MNLSRRHLFALLCILLGAFTLLVYLPVVHHGFVSLDDYQYIRDNPRVYSGLSWANASWAFTSSYACNWHPMTWLSHMLDCQLYGLSPAGHHLTNVLLHAANTVLLFAVLCRLTSLMWPGAFVAAFFGWHPLHVESVAWASERKDVLCGFFWLLTVYAYARYVERASIWTSAEGLQPAGSKLHPSAPDVLRRFRRSRTGWYCLTLLFFALGLMSKPMAVTLPCVLLLLDFWPFERWSFDAARTTPKNLLKLFTEKLPMFAMAGVASALTFVAQQQGGATASLQGSALYERLSNAVVSYVKYLGKIFWPTDLAPLYPLTAHLPVTLVAGAALLLIVITTVCLLLARRHGFFFTGWFLFVGVLVPVIGLVQVGSQAMADRYMYLPSIGIFLAVVWGCMRLQDQLGLPEVLFSGSGLVAAAFCLISTALQLRCWESTEALARRAIEVVPDNYMAYSLLGKALDDNGRQDGGLYYFSRACEINPYYSEAEFNCGTLLLRAGAAEEAIPHFQAVLKGQPSHVDALHGLGNSYLRLSMHREAKSALSRAVVLAPGDAELHQNLGTALLALHELAGAEKELTRSVGLSPNHLEARRNLGVVLAMQGRIKDALPHFAKAVELSPNDPDMRFNYGLALFETRRFQEAENQFQAGATLRPGESRFHYRLALSLSRQGRSAEAAAEYRRTLELEPDFADALNELAGILSAAEEPSLRSGTEAVKLATRACKLTGYKEARFLTTLASAYAESGRYRNAVETARKASEVASATGDREGSMQADEALLSFQSGRPFRKKL